jgi:PIN domain nuclease of toxin-antitoxin system
MGCGKMIILDTCVLIFDALTPKRLTMKAKKAIDKAEHQNELFCCDISLWEVAMLIQKKRLDPGVESSVFLQLMLNARRIQIWPINVEIAAIACSPSVFNHADPADRLIAATAIHHGAKLITSDQKLTNISHLDIIW